MTRSDFILSKNIGKVEAVIDLLQQLEYIDDPMLSRQKDSLLEDLDTFKNDLIREIPIIY